MRWKKFLKPCVGLSVGKLDWVCVKLQRIVNRVRVVRKFAWKSKFGCFGVRQMVALLSFRLAYNVSAYCVWLILKTNLSHVCERNYETKTTMQHRTSQMKYAHCWQQLGFVCNCRSLFYFFTVAWL